MMAGIKAGCLMPSLVSLQMFGPSGLASSSLLSFDVSFWGVTMTPSHYLGPNVWRDYVLARD